MRKSPVIALLLFLALAASASHARDAGDFVLGRVVDQPARFQAETQAIADHLVTQLKDAGYTRARVVLSTGVDEMVQLMKAGEIDMLSHTALVAARLIDEAGAEVLLKALRRREASHRSVFVARKDNPIQSLAELRGHVIAFEDETSSTGFIIPRALLLAHGLELVHLKSPRAPVPKDKVGYVFAGGQEINAALMVHKRVVSASAFGNADINTEFTMPEAIRSDMKVFYQSPEFPRSLILVRRGMPVTAKQRLKDVLLTLPFEPGGADLLQGYHAISGFDSVSAADWKGITEARRLNEIVRKRLK